MTCGLVLCWRRAFGSSPWLHLYLMLHYVGATGSFRSCCKIHVKPLLNFHMSTATVVQVSLLYFYTCAQRIDVSPRLLSCCAALSVDEVTVCANFKFAHATQIPHVRKMRWNIDLITLPDVCCTRFEHVAVHSSSWSLCTCFWHCCWRC